MTSRAAKSELLSDREAEFSAFRDKVAALEETLGTLRPVLAELSEALADAAAAATGWSCLQHRCCRVFWRIGLGKRPGLGSVVHGARSRARGRGAARGLGWTWRFS